MSEPDRLPFRFWRFFFSLQGRVSRLPYALFVVGPLAFFAALTLMHGLIRQGFFVENPGMLYAAIGIAKLLLLWPHFAVISKRLHDLGSNLLPAFAWFLPLAGSIGMTIWQMRPVSNPLETPSSPDVAVGIYAQLAFSVLNIALLLAAVILSIIPGTKGTNRYGPSPRATSAQAVSEIF